MSVKRIHTNAMGMPSAKIPLALMPVRVAQDSKEMDCYVMTSMSVKRIHTNVVDMPSAKTPLAPMTVHVAQDSKEMDCCAMT